MSKIFKQWLRDSIPDGVKKFVGYSEEVEYGTVSFSQFGEDMVLRNFFPNKVDGFYIDVGAHHPIKFSNTYFFYKRGWSGICIDPLPGIEKDFIRLRPRDRFLNVGLSDQPGKAEYHVFKNPLENTFSPALASEVNISYNPLIQIQQVTVARLDRILDESVSGDTRIDFMTIDAEGFDLKVLMSNNWSRYRPKYVLVEDFIFDFEHPAKSSIAQFLTSINYRIVAVVNKSFFWICNNTN